MWTDEKLASSAVTTTTCGRVRGFSIELLFLLSEGEARCADLSEMTGYSRAYVYCYLKNLRKYGLALNHGSFWFLTESGILFVTYLNSFKDRLVKCRKIEERKKEERRKKKEGYRHIEVKQISIEPFFRDSCLQEVEKEVVEVLVTHYNETGSKFVLVKDQYDLAERLKRNPQDLLPALQRLRQDNIIYVFRNQPLDCWKVGLKKHFVELLERMTGLKTL